MPMRVVIYGEGESLRALLTHPLFQKAPVHILSSDPDFLKRLSEESDFPCVLGDPLNSADLRKAGVNEQTVFIAMGMDNARNILSACLAKKLQAQASLVLGKNFPPASEALCLQETFLLDSLFDIDNEEALTISRRIEFPKIFQSEKFIQGDAVMNEVEIHGKSPLLSHPVKEIALLRKFPNLRLAAYRRGNEISIVKGGSVFLEGDHVLVIGEEKSMTPFLEKAHLIQGGGHKAFLVGGGKVALLLAEILHGDGVHVTILEENPARCAEILESHPGIEVLHGSGSNMALLKDFHLAKYDAVVSLTGNEEKNALISLFAQGEGVKKIIAEIEEPALAAILAKNGIDDALSSRSIAINALANRVGALLHSGMGKNSSLKALYPLFGGNLRALVFTLPESFSLYGIPLKDPRFQFRDDVFIGGILSSNTLRLADGSSQFEKGDEALVLTTNPDLDSWGEIFHR
jgi:trk system potassium uptake protein TrkA